MADANTQKATLTSPDGLYKTVVSVGSTEASQLMQRGWALGDSGRSVIDVNQALTAQSQTGTTPFFRGDYALVKFSEDPGPGNTSTIWLVDPKTKTLRPFLNEMAFNNFFTETLEEAVANGRIQTVPVSYLGSSGVLNGFKLLSDSEGIPSSGVLPPVAATVDNTKLSTRYGQSLDEEAQEWAYSKVIKPWLELVRNDASAGISSTIIDEIENDPSVLALYISAVTYGNYQLPDIYRDIKRRQLIKEGNTAMQNVKIIDEAMTANEYYNTTQGTTARSNPSLTPPSTIGDLSINTLQSPVFNLPDEVFQVLSPPFDWTTPEGKEELENIKSAYHDVLAKQLDAANEQEAQLAKQYWEEFKSDMARNYGIQLSDNAYQAWNQIQSIGTTLSGKGLYGSGIHQQALDKYLRDVRKTDQRAREQKMTTEERQERTYYLTSASPEEIAALSEEKKIAWGLKPSAETAEWFSLENLRQEFPDLSEEELQSYRNSIIDPNGYYRSQAFQQYEEKKQQLAETKQEYQLDKLLQDKTREEELAYQEFTKSDPFSKIGTKEIPQKEESNTPSVANIPSSSNINPYASSQAAYTARTGKIVPGYDQYTQSNSSGTSSEQSTKGLHVQSPDWLKYYKPEELMPYNPGDKIYLKPGIEKRW